MSDFFHKRHNYFRKASKLMIYAALQFAVLTAIAMWFYPGSTLYDNSSSGYSMAHNFFSDLGTTITYSGQGNVISSILFTLGLLTIGASMLYFSKTSESFGGQPILQFLSRLTLILSGLGFIGVALTPWNLYLDIHKIFVKTAFPFLTLYVLITILQQRRHKNLFLWVNCIYLICCSAYTLILFFGPKLSTVEGVETQVIAQKIIVYLSICALAFQAFGILKKFPERKV